MQFNIDPDSGSLRSRLDFRRSLGPCSEERGLISRTVAGDRAYLRSWVAGGIVFARVRLLAAKLPYKTSSPHSSHDFAVPMPKSRRLRLSKFK